jgi:autotransporter strand-loop-strand O-heptosyltransferase
MYSLGWFYDYNLEPELPNTIPLQKTATNILGLDFKEIKPIIDFNPKEKPYKNKYVTIAPQSTSGLKYWNNENGWDEVVSFLINEGYDVVNVSVENCNLKNVINIKDTSIKNTMNVIHHSDFLIGLSSGLSWLAWAIDKHVVIISNFTQKDHEFTSNCTRIINESVCNGCWNKPIFKFDKNDWNWCPEHKGTTRQFECHKSITGENVIKKLKPLIK